MTWFSAFRVDPIQPDRLLELTVRRAIRPVIGQPDDLVSFPGTMQGGAGLIPPEECQADPGRTMPDS